jgi:hypothetical protein
MDPDDQKAPDANQRLKERKLEILEKAVDFILDFLKCNVYKHDGHGFTSFLKAFNSHELSDRLVDFAYDDEITARDQFKEKN